MIVTRHGDPDRGVAAFVFCIRGIIFFAVKCISPCILWPMPFFTNFFYFVNQSQVPPYPVLARSGTCVSLGHLRHEAGRNNTPCCPVRLNRLLKSDQGQAAQWSRSRRVPLVCSSCGLPAPNPSAAPERQKVRQASAARNRPWGLGRRVG